MNLEQLEARTVPYSAFVSVTNHVAVLSLDTTVADVPVLIDVSRTSNGDMKIQLQGIGSKMPEYYYHFTGVEIDITGPQPVTVQIDNSVHVPVVVNGEATVLHGSYPPAVVDMTGRITLTGEVGVEMTIPVTGHHAHHAPKHRPHHGKHQ